MQGSADVNSGDAGESSLMFVNVGECRVAQMCIQVNAGKCSLMFVNVGECRVAQM